MIGNEVYNVDAGSVVARGISHDDSELIAAFAGPIKAIITDSDGKHRIEGFLTNLATSEFQTAAIAEIIENSSALTSHRLGEAIAESFLIETSNCEFPFPMARDQRNPNANAAGADLVGFVSHAGSFRFAFGEVKTSSDESCPPQVMYGQGGLKQQLEGLRDDRKVSNALVRYLSHKYASSVVNSTKFESAASRYLSNHRDITIYGVMVRDVAPNSIDLATRAKSLHKDCPNHIGIELKALYFSAPISEMVALFHRSTAQDNLNVN
ncbi:MAG: hypothetical protein JST89_12155 [Cyanobacteria bacterium SZAS-4]|nr:hypothetical protein [Cyanobacteria bacterium SZAS-4]